MNLKETVSCIMKQAIDNNEVMGVNLLIKKGGEELVYQEEGLVDRENNYPVRRWLAWYVFCQFSGRENDYSYWNSKKDAGTFALTRKLRNVILSNL